VVWQKAYTSNQTAKHLSNTHDHILVYAKNVNAFKLGRLPRTEEQKQSFSNFDKDARGPWKAENLSAGKFYSAGQFPITGPTGQIFMPPKGRYWRCNEQQYQAWLMDNRITFGRNGDGRPMLKKFLQEMKDELTANTWWLHEEVGSNKEASIDLKAMFGESENVFQNPKPEKLINRILTLSTSQGDLVLDSFGGSGTTGAVAHKMGRRWIMVELGEHCHTHIIPRLQKVIDGQDSGGVTEAMGWKGGGGFRYYSLAPSLIVNDRWGNPVINPAYNPAQLSEALCKLEAFSYAPSETRWWQHGHSSERDFIVVTTQNLSAEQLQALADEVGEEQSLLVCCAAYHGVTAAKAAERWPNLTLKKIPKMVLSRCEWGHDDYSLNVANLPMAQEGPVVAPAAKATRVKKQAAPQPGLFGDAGEEF
jgi:adenine-specific DNA-methyltransferase